MTARFFKLEEFNAEASIQVRIACCIEIFDGLRREITFAICGRLRGAQSGGRLLRLRVVSVRTQCRFAISHGFRCGWWF